jgi:uncharacterized protein involved in exopolysaccharide biosynthesis
VKATPSKHAPDVLDELDDGIVLLTECEVIDAEIEEAGPAVSIQRFVLRDPIVSHDLPSAFVDSVMSLQRFVAFFAPYRFVLLALMVAGLIAGVASAMLLPPKSVAVFDVRLQSTASVNPLERATASLDFFRSASTTFRSAGAIHRTLATMGESAATSARVAEIQSALSFERTGDEQSQTYVGRFSDGDPAWSVKFLRTHMDGYLDAEINKTLGIIGARVDFLNVQLAATEHDLRGTEAELLAFKTNNADGLPEQAKQYYDHQFALQKRESALAADVSRHDAEAAVGARRLQGETALVESRMSATRPYQLAIVDGNRQLADARAAGLSDGHPDVRALQAKLVELRRLANDAERGGDDVDVERSRNPIFDATNDRVQRARASASATRQERARLHEDQTRIDAIVARLPALEAEHADLTRSYEATRKLHTRLFDQQRTTSIQYALEEASAAARFEIISPPHLQHQGSFAGFVTRRAAFCCAFGVLAGLAFAVLARLRDALNAMAPVPRSR